MNKYWDRDKYIGTVYMDRDKYRDRDKNRDNDRI